MKTFTKNTLLSSALILSASAASHLECASECSRDHAQHEHNHAHAPIGVMGAHLHKKGEWMLSYRFMFMNMEENYNGDDTVSTAEVLDDPRFMVSPIDMQMEMHMIGAMYGLNDDITLMGMVNILNYKMLHRNVMGREFTTASSGLGDASIGAIFRIFENDNHQFLGGLNIVLPTAETDKKDDIPNMMGVPINRTLPYPMQLGSGSWGIKPSLTYTYTNGAYTLGAQVNGHLQLTDNDNDYRLGDTLNANLWGSYQINDQLSTSLRVQSSNWTNIEGQHDTLAPLPVPTTNTSLRGGKKIDAYWGISYSPSWTKVRLSSEFGKTLWQDLDGPQLGADWTATFGIQTAF